MVCLGFSQESVLLVKREAAIQNTQAVKTNQRSFFSVVFFCQVETFSMLTDFLNHWDKHLLRTKIFVSLAGCLSSTGSILTTVF